MTLAIARAARRRSPCSSPTADRPPRRLGGLRRQFAAIAALAAAALAIAVVALFVRDDVRLAPRRADDRSCVAALRGGAGAVGDAAARPPRAARRRRRARDARRRRRGRARRAHRRSTATTRSPALGRRRRRDDRAPGPRGARAARRCSPPSRTTCARRSPRCRLLADGDRRRGRRRRHAARVRRAHEHARARARRADRRPVRAHAPARRTSSTWTMEQVRARRAAATRRSRRCAPPPTPARSPCAPSCTASSRPPRGNPEQLQRVLFNLIQNAIRHTPPDGSVTVRAEDGRRRRRGRGRRHRRRHRAPSTRERVFEPFYRADAARRDRGAGLGLAISRAIVEAHGGADLARGRAGRHARALPAAGGGRVGRGNGGWVGIGFRRSRRLRRGRSGEPSCLSVV